MYTLSKENFIRKLNLFTINSLETINDLYLIVSRDDMTVGQKLHFVEKICELHCPWILIYFDIFWALIEMPINIETTIGVQYIFDIYYSYHGVRTDKNINPILVINNILKVKEIYFRRKNIKFKVSYQS